MSKLLNIKAIVGFCGITKPEGKLSMTLYVDKDTAGKLTEIYNNYKGVIAGLKTSLKPVRVEHLRLNEFPTDKYTHELSCKNNLPSVIRVSDFAKNAIELDNVRGGDEILITLLIKDSTYQSQRFLTYSPQNIIKLRSNVYHRLAVSPEQLKESDNDLMKMLESENIDSNDVVGDLE